MLYFRTFLGFSIIFINTSRLFKYLRTNDIVEPLSRYEFNSALWFMRILIVVSLLFGCPWSLQCLFIISLPMGLSVGKRCVTWLWNRGVWGRIAFIHTKPVITD